MNDHVEEGNYCENQTAAAMNAIFPVYKLYEVDADLAAKLCTVKQIE